MLFVAGALSVLVDEPSPWSVHSGTSLVALVSLEESPIPDASPSDGSASWFSNAAPLVVSYPSPEILPGSNLLSEAAVTLSIMCSL